MRMTKMAATALALFSTASFTTTASAQNGWKVLQDTLATMADQMEAKAEARREQADADADDDDRESAGRSRASRENAETNRMLLHQMRENNERQQAAARDRLERAQETRRAQQATERAEQQAAYDRRVAENNAVLAKAARDTELLYQQRQANEAARNEAAENRAASAARASSKSATGSAQGDCWWSGSFWNRGMTRSDVSDCGPPPPSASMRTAQ